MLTIPDLSQSAVQTALKKKLRFIEDARVKERDYLMDWYEGINLENYVSNYFGAETLRQAVIPQNNLTRRVCSLRSMTYKRPPRMRSSESYTSLIDKHSLNAQRRMLERLTFLLGTMAFRSYWDGDKIRYQSVSHFEPLFLAGSPRDEPVGVCFPIEYQGNARMNTPLHAVWTHESHYLLDEHGVKISVNEGDINPYGILPVTFSHRYPPIRDYSVGNATDVVQTDLAVNVAILELEIAIRYGAMGIKFISGVDDASRITVGSDKILYLPEGANFGVTNAGGSLTEIIDATRFLVETTLNNNHIRAKYARDNSGNAPSAAALAIEELENKDEPTAMTEDTWRPWEHRRYEVDRAIIQVEAGTDVGDDYSVDFLEPNYALTPESEIMLWDWRFKNGLASKEQWFEYQNPDASQEEIAKFSQMQQSQQAPQNRLLNILTNDNRPSS